MTETATTLQSIAQISTANASRYLQQLCKHFAHKREVSFTPHEGKIVFTAGPCDLKATDNLLTITVSAPDEAGIALLHDVVVRHLVRFAFREELKIAWTPR